MWVKILFVYLVNVQAIFSEQLAKGEQFSCLYIEIEIESKFLI